MHLSLYVTYERVYETMYVIDNLNSSLIN